VNYLILLLVVAQTPVVRIQAVERGSVSSWGTGTCVASTSESLVITASHVVKDGHEFKINGQTAKLVSADRLWDLAALVVPTRLPVANIGTTRPAIGDLLTVCGYGSGNYREAKGQVLQYVSPGNGIDDILIMGAKARNGDSGGPIFDNHGILVAVLFGSTEYSHGSCCVQVRKFIAGLNIDPRLKQQALRKSYVIYGGK